jgi:hypothetical protein
MDDRVKLHWGRKEIEDLNDLIDDLRIAIEDAPCLVSRPGEMTYECSYDRPCRVCEWRISTLADLKHRWRKPNPV